MISLHFHSKSNLSVTHINTYTHWTVFFSFIFRLFAFDPLTPFYSFQLVNVSTEICRFRFVVWNCCSRYHILMLNFHLSCKRWWNIFDFTFIQTLILSKALQKKIIFSFDLEICWYRFLRGMYASKQCHGDYTTDTNLNQWARIQLEPHWMCSVLFCWCVVCIILLSRC